MSFLPNEMLDAEDDRLSTELIDATMDDRGFDSPASIIADYLDPEDADRDDIATHVTDAEKRRLLFLYAKLGRNVFLRILDKRRDDDNAHAGKE